MNSAMATYDIVNTTTGLLVSSTNAYDDTNMISFDGMQVSIKGDPAHGDEFIISPSNNQGVF